MAGILSDTALVLVKRETSTILLYRLTVEKKIMKIRVIVLGKNETFIRLYRKRHRTQSRIYAPGTFEAVEI